MIRKLALILAVVALLCATGAVQAAAAPTATASRASTLTKHTTTFTAKHKYRNNKTGEVVTGIRTRMGLWPGVDKVVETVDPAATLMAPDSASALSWQRVGYVIDEATWTGSNDPYYYTFAVQASVGWQAAADGVYYDFGPFQYRQNPACFRHPKTGGSELGTPCNFQFNSSALEAKQCPSSSSCSINAPWGFRDFYQANVLSVLFAGSWHNTANVSPPYEFNDSLMSFTGDATARFLVPNHVTRIYCTGSFWWTIGFSSDVHSDFCSGMTAIS
jgi:hypothetical protein